MPEHTQEGSDQQLLLYCARAGGYVPDRVRALARAVTDWDALVAAAEFHGVAAILYRIVDGTCRDLLPEGVVSRLRNDDSDSARQNLILTAQLLELLLLFQSEGIAVLPLKGPSLAESLYPDPLLRPFSDLDVLVHKQDVPAAVQALTREGYTLRPYLARLPLRIQMGRLDPQLIFSHERKAEVDIQWETARADFPFRFDTEILWRSRISIQIAGREVPSLSRESLLLFLCVHGTKHMWSHLQWLGDVARLVRAPLDWSIALQLAAEAKCERPVLLGLLLAHELLEAPVPAEILERSRAQKPVLKLARQLKLRLMRIPLVHPHGMELFTFSVRLAERTRDKVWLSAALLKAPTEAELEMFRLPERWFFLYYPLRVVRLALKYGRRLAIK